MKITAIAATTTEPSDAFTDEQLQQLAETAIDVPVLDGFDPDKLIGKVVSARIVDGRLEVSADIKGRFDGLFLVPGYRKDSVGPNAKCTSLAFGISSSPMDKSLTPMQVIDSPNLHR